MALKSCLAAIKVLRHFAIKKNYIVDDHESNDPTWKINIVKPLYNKMIVPNIMKQFSHWNN